MQQAEPSVNLEKIAQGTKTGVTLLWSVVVTVWGSCKGEYRNECQNWVVVVSSSTMM